MINRAAQRYLTMSVDKISYHMGIMVRMQKTIYLFAFIIGLSLPVAAQETAVNYTDARELMIIGKAAPTINTFQRLDSAQFAAMPKVVKALCLNSSGIAVLFETNSPVIRAKWTLAKKGYYPN